MSYARPAEVLFPTNSEDIVVISGGRLGSDMNPPCPGDQEQNGPVKFHTLLFELFSVPGGERK